MLNNLRLLIIAILSLGFGSHIAAQPITLVKTALVESHSIATKQWAPGTVVSKNNALISSEVAGQILTIAEVGTHIKQGEVMAIIDKEALIIQRQEKQAEIKSLMARRDFLLSQRDRMQKLVSKNAVAQSNFDDIQSQYGVVSENIKLQQLSLKNIQRLIDKSAIVAPYSGIVSAKLKSIGELITANEPLLRMVDTTNIEIQSQVPIALARTNQRGAQVALRNNQNIVYSFISAIVPVANNASRLIEMRITLPPLKVGQWYVGESVWVGLANSQVEQLTTIPRDALILREEQSYVFVVDSSEKEIKAKKVEVDIVTGEGSMLGIKGQLNPGDSVIIYGAETLKDGQKINIST